MIAWRELRSRYTQHTDPLRTQRRLELVALLLVMFICLQLVAGLVGLAVSTGPGPIEPAADSLRVPAVSAPIWLLPTLVAQGTTFRLALPGTSAVDLDERRDRDAQGAVGRYRYSGRGWARRVDHFVVAGIEKIDGAARGGHNTVGNPTRYADLLPVLAVALGGVPPVRRNCALQRSA